MFGSLGGGPDLSHPWHRDQERELAFHDRGVRQLAQRELLDVALIPPRYLEPLKSRKDMVIEPSFLHS